MNLKQIFLSGIILNTFFISTIANTLETLFAYRECLLVTIGLDKVNKTANVSKYFLYMDRTMIHWESIYLKHLEENTHLELHVDHATILHVVIKILTFHR